MFSVGGFVLTSLVILADALVVMIPFLGAILGLVIVNERQVGIVVRRIGPRLEPGKLIALNGEAGYQADTLAPGWHFFYWPQRYKVTKVPVFEHLWAEAVPYQVSKDKMVADG